MQRRGQLACSWALFHAAWTRNAFLLIHYTADSFEILCPAPREARTLLEHSFGYITREKPASSSFPIEEDVSKNQPDSHNQQDSLKSASHKRTRKIPSNRQDYLESARLPNPTDTRPRLLTTEPSPSTAFHSFWVSAV